MNTFISFGQDDYELFIERESDCAPVCILATDNNESIAAFNLYNIFETELVKINSTGDIINSLRLSHTDSAYCLGHISKSIQQGYYIGVGWKFLKSKPDIKYLWLFSFNDNLKIGWERIIDTLKYYGLNQARITYLNNAYFLNASQSDAYNYFPKHYKNFLYKITPDGVVLKKTEADSYAPIYYFRNIPSTSYFLKGDDPDDFYAYVLNDQLDFITTIQPTIYPNNNPDMGSPLDLEFINTTEFIRSGLMERKPNALNHVDVFSVKKADTASRNEAKVKKFGYAGAEMYNGCYPGALKSLAMQDNYFFHAGFSYVMIISGDPYHKYDNFLMLYAFDYNLDSLWSINLGIDNNQGNYILYYIDATADGGCLLAAGYYDWRAEDGKISTYIAKIHKPNFTNITESNKPQVAVSVFPNPGKDIMLIQTELDNFTLQLYDMQGQLLLTKKKPERSQYRKITVRLLHLPYY